MKTPSVSIVIPALNEEKTIGRCIRKAITTLKKLNIEREVIVADNGSTDKTQAIALTEGARIVPVTKKGYGAACLGGIEAAQGAMVLMADADDSYNFEEIAPFFKALESVDFVMGNRFLGTIEDHAMPFLHRYLGTPVLTFLMNSLFKTGCGDVNCGMRAFKKEAIVHLNLAQPGMEFATEMVVKASMAKLRITEVPCNLYRDKRDRKPHLNTWRDGWRHLRFILLFTPFSTFLIPGGVALLVGIAAIIMFSLRDSLNLTFLPALDSKHSISSLLLTILGAQLISFGLVAQSFGYAAQTRRNRYAFLAAHKTKELGALWGVVTTVLGGILFLYLLLSFYGSLPSVRTTVRFDIAVIATGLVIIGILLTYTALMLGYIELEKNQRT